MAAPKIIPRHIAIIMDGNGRWARQRGLPRIKGHEKGADAVRECVEGCGELKVEYLTLYAFSAENWQRPKSEVFALMRLLENFLLWQLSYTEMYVTSKLWPDFTRKDLFAAVDDFAKRQRRYGGV